MGTPEWVKLFFRQSLLTLLSPHPCSSLLFVSSLDERELFSLWTLQGQHDEDDDDEDASDDYSSGGAN